jgi:hypothetical protein
MTLDRLVDFVGKAVEVLILAKLFEGRLIILMTRR